LLTIGSPAYVLPLLTRGSMISHSSVVQGAHTNVFPDFPYLVFAARTLAEPNIILFALLLVGIVKSVKRREYYLMLFLMLGLPIVQAMVAPQQRHHGRYLFILYPIIILFAIATWETVQTKVSIRFQQIVVVLLFASGVVSTARWSYLTASDVRNINDQHLAAVNWL